jgi:hypothetical protein
MGDIQYRHTDEGGRVTDLTCSSAPTSSHDTLGVVAKPSRLALGCTFLMARRKSWVVAVRTSIHGCHVHERALACIEIFRGSSCSCDK